MFDFIDLEYNEEYQALETSLYIPDAAECMRCGLCVSSCPTFRLFQTNEETPRQRLRTISKILIDKQAISTNERKQLDNCLQCRACEISCPSYVAYGQLFDQARLALETKPTALANLAFKLIEKKRLRSWLMPLLAIYLKFGLQKPLRYFNVLKKLHLSEADTLFAKPALQAMTDRYPTSKIKRGQVAMFTGCIAEHLDRNTLMSAIKLLNEIGYEVLVPKQQSCCGAIHQHNGQSANTFVTNNIEVFNALEVDAVLHVATGCGAMLSEYRSDDNIATAYFLQRLRDINEFVLKQWPNEIKLIPSKLKVSVHEPCSQRNILKNQAIVYALLHKIPDITVTELANNNLCCGAGGSYMLTHPNNAKQLRTLKLQSISKMQVDIVVSSNFGCSVFLNNDQCKVVHPLVVLARHLESAGE
ncbi:MAG: (Fe-S)-binding protein [Methylococcales bacterium]|nr:MAG: (Fe-S)-binding protein [Methylococcales bacterium]